MAVQTHRWPAPVACLGDLSVGTLIWRHRGVTRLTVAVKVCYRIDESGNLHGPVAMPIIPVDTSRGEPNEVGALLPRCELHLCTRRDAVFQVALFRDQRTLGTKTGKPAAFAPILANHPSRKPMMDTIEGGVMLAFPDDFDWSAMQAVAADQQVANLVAGDWVVVGARDDAESLRICVPQATPHIKAYGKDAPALPSPKLDMVRVDLDERICSLVWRSVAIAQKPAALLSLTIAAAVDVGGQGVSFPDELDAGSISKTRPLPAGAMLRNKKLTIPSGKQKLAPQLQATAPTKGQLASAPLPFGGVAAPGNATPGNATPGNATPGEGQPKPATGAPWDTVPSAAAGASKTAAVEPVLPSTPMSEVLVTVEHNVDVRALLAAAGVEDAAMPFASSARKQGAANTPNKPIPGAPWNEQRPRVQATPFEPTPDTSTEPSGNAADPASPPPPPSPPSAAPVARAQRPPRPKPPAATLPSVVPAVPPRVPPRVPKSPPPSAAMPRSQAAGVAASPPPPAAAPRPPGATTPSPTLPAVGVSPTKPATVAGSKMASAPATTDVAARLAELEQRRIELAQRVEERRMQSQHEEKLLLEELEREKKERQAAREAALERQEQERREKAQQQQREDEQVAAEKKRERDAALAATRVRAEKVNTMLYGFRIK